MPPYTPTKLGPLDPPERVPAYMIQPGDRLRFDGPPSAGLGAGEYTVARVKRVQTRRIGGRFIVSLLGPGDEATQRSYDSLTKVRLSYRATTWARMDAIGDDAMVEAYEQGADPQRTTEAGAEACEEAAGAALANDDLVIALTVRYDAAVARRTPVALRGTGKVTDLVDAAFGFDR